MGVSASKLKLNSANQSAAKTICENSKNCFDDSVINEPANATDAVVSVLPPPILTEFIEEDCEETMQQTQQPQQQKQPQQSQQQQSQITSKLETNSSDPLLSIKDDQNDQSTTKQPIESHRAPQASNNNTISSSITAKQSAPSSSQIKYIDESDESGESFSKANRSEHENDYDSGNASISSDNSHHFYEECSGSEPDLLNAQICLRPKREKNHLPQAPLPPPPLGTTGTTTASFYHLYRYPHHQSAATFTDYQRLSSASFASTIVSGDVHRFATLSVLSQIEQLNLRKMIAKLRPGDLIELRCVCNCASSKGVLPVHAAAMTWRASFHSHHHRRQRFRRTLERQSFHQFISPVANCSTTFANSSSTTGIFSISNHSSNTITNFQPQPPQPPQAKPPKRRSALNFRNIFRRSCIGGSVDTGSMQDIRTITKSTITDQPARYRHTMMMSTNSGSIHSYGEPPQPQQQQQQQSQQCSEQFHYVYVHQIDDDDDQNQPSPQPSPSPQKRRDQQIPLRNIWCYHVRPYHRMALLEDDRHLGMLKHETLETIIGQFLIEMEDRHWQYGRNHLRQPKLAVHYEVRNQAKLAESILKRTLNAQPDCERVIGTLRDATNSFVRYHRTRCNAEHYVTLWRYGIGWSTWVSGRADIHRTVHDFVVSLSQVGAPLQTGTSNNAKQQLLQLQAGECTRRQTNLIVHCFGLHGDRLHDSIRQWIRGQVVIEPANYRSSRNVEPNLNSINNDDDDDEDNDNSNDDNNSGIEEIEKNRKKVNETIAEIDNEEQKIEEQQPQQEQNIEILVAHDDDDALNAVATNA